jgi:hypothetical protein
MAKAEEIPGNQQENEDHVVDAPEPTIADVTSHGNDVYELHALDMVESEPQKTRSKLRLVAILIALDVSSSCIIFMSLSVKRFDLRLI